MLMWKLNVLVGRCKDRGLNIGYREINKATGISTSTIYEITHGRTTRVDFSTVDRLLAFFSEQLDEELSISDLLEWKRESSAASVN